MFRTLILPSIVLAGILVCLGLIKTVVPRPVNVEFATVVVTDMTEMGHGTGVYIGNDEVLTAGHVTHEDDKDGNMLVVFGKQKVKAHVVWSDETKDVGLLKLDAPLKGIEVLPLVCGAPEVKVGDYLEVYGFPLVFNKVHTYGRVATGVQELEGHTFFVGDVTAAPGNSGGPALSNGRLVGIVVGIAAQGNSMLPIQTPYRLSIIVPTSVACQEFKDHQ